MTDSEMKEKIREAQLEASFLRPRNLSTVRGHEISGKVLREAKEQRIARGSLSYAERMRANPLG